MALRNVNIAATFRFVEWLKTLKTQYPNLVTAFFEAEQLGWEFAVVDQTRGLTKYHTKEFTIPLWATKKATSGYELYYLSHELAHIFAGQKVAHDPEFMAVFRRICPPEFQHYELHYKPKFAIAAGIAAEDF